MGAQEPKPQFLTGQLDLLTQIRAMQLERVITANAELP